MLTIAHDHQRLHEFDVIPLVINCNSLLPSGLIQETKNSQFDFIGGQCHEQDDFFISRFKLAAAMLMISKREK